MKENNFIFADLSTYDLKSARRFYSNVFGWTYKSGGDYFVAEHKGQQVSGLYETPQKFKDMNMPSFWMSYIQVEDVQETVSKAKSLGGIIELVDETLPIGKIALIRDVLGAGFTVYEGDNLNARFENEENALIWNELFTLDFSKIKPFYEGIFNWKFESAGDADGCRFYIKNAHQQIGAIQEVDNQIKGDKNYWSVFFGVSNKEKTKKIALENGGSIVYEDDTTTVLADTHGAFFHIEPIEPNARKLSKEKAPSSRLKTSNKTIKWKSILGLSLIGLGIINNWFWIWGIFFAVWVISDLRSGSTYMLEPVSRRENPLLYGILIAVWSFIGVYSMTYYINLQYSGYSSAQNHSVLDNIVSMSDMILDKSNKSLGEPVEKISKKITGNNFVFADLLTFDTETAKHFYGEVFGWNYEGEKNYFVANYKGKYFNGLYQMPKKLKESNNSSFWAPYIQVRSIQKTVNKAKLLGGSVEIIDGDQYVGRIALIKDPMGARFVIYQGDYLRALSKRKQTSIPWNELFVSEFSKIKPFYKGLFNWKFESAENAKSYRFYIKNVKNEKIGAIQKLDKQIKGVKNYWSVSFGVLDTEKTKKIALKNGGALIYEGRRATLLTDPQGAFFYIFPLPQQ